ncbi:HEAT repeat domain-containing protein [Sphingobacterium sp. SRCM116780]|uniref:HEAT repeat domain-containing protein n=1 Tax=Sphingobacterium sp. SRCM116780 TaxID=2907623 RepID=UPI001F356116|nr:HEAT repeat domain-containing protein [Sphingobacterium sp. SRCM116780]UIR56451.1 HEAT repeat domain-containing protein [Sphingobacterium sp. SRCM116780]
MFDFWKFYNGLLNRTDYFDNYWDQFPQGHLFRFKSLTLSLLEDNFSNKNVKGLCNTLAVICNDGADRDYTNILLQLLDEKWHISEEDIVSVLELIKDPKSIDKLYEIAVNVPDYDDMRALAKKCMWALSDINTPEAIQKLELLSNSDDFIIKENALFQLHQVINKS